MTMQKLILIILVGFCLNSCKQKTEIILSKYNNGNTHEVLILSKPLTKDSIGTKKIYFEDGKLNCEGGYKKGKRNGEWTCYYPNSRIEWQGNFKDDKENGEVLCNYSNGTWRKTNFLNGIKDHRLAA